MILTFWKKSQCFTARKQKKTRKTPNFTDYAVDCGRRRRFYLPKRPRKNRVAGSNLIFFPIPPILTPSTFRADFRGRSNFSLFPDRLALTFVRVSPILTLRVGVYRRAAPKNAPGGFCEIPSSYIILSTARVRPPQASRSTPALSLVLRLFPLCRRRSPWAKTARFYFNFYRGAPPTVALRRLLCPRVTNLLARLVNVKSRSNRRKPAKRSLANAARRSAFRRCLR